MANETTTTTAAEFTLASVVSRMISEIGYESNEILPLVRVDSIANEPTLTKDFPKWNDISAGPADLTEATDIGTIGTGNTAINPTERTVTVREVGFKIVLTDLLLTSSITRDLGPYIRQMGLAMAVKVMTDLLAEAADFASSVGASGANLTEANILTAIYTIDAASQSAPLVGVLHAIQLHDFRTDLAGATGVVHGRTDFMEVGRGIVYLGVPFIRNNQCASVNADADRQGVLMPVGDYCGLAYLEKQDVKVEPERDASMRGTELVITHVYGDNCVDTTAWAGIAIITDHE